MKKMIRAFLARHKSLSYLLFRLSSRLNMKSYALASAFAECYAGDSINPKHEIIGYREWFADQLQKDWTVLDIGCHNGHMVEFMAGQCRFVYGIEISAELVREAREKRLRPNVEFICADAAEYDYSDINRVDCLTLSNVLEHIEDRVSFLQNLIRKMPWIDEKNKRFLIRVPLLERDWIPVFMERLGLDYRLDSTHFTEYTVESFNKEMEKAGLVVGKYHVRFGELYAVCLGQL